MSPTRRARGSVIDPIDISFRVERVNKEHFAFLAKRAGLSNAALFDTMVENIVLDDRGLPTWLPRENKEQLPIE